MLYERQALHEKNGVSKQPRSLIGQSTNNGAFFRDNMVHR